MRVERRRQSERALNQHLARRVRYMVPTANYVRDILVRIVHYHCKMENRLIKRTCNDEIPKVSYISCYLSADDVSKSYRSAGISETYNLFSVAWSLRCFF